MPARRNSSTSDTAGKLRNIMVAADYKQVALGLIVLNYFLTPRNKPIP